MARSDPVFVPGAMGLAAVALGACTQLAAGSDLGEASTPEQADLAGVVPASMPRGHEAADAAGEPSAARWACLEQPARPRAVPNRPSVSLALAIVEIASREPPEDARARACSRLDVGCEAPVSEAASAGGSELLLRLPQGFDGFVEVTSPSSVPALYFLSRGLDGDAFETLFVVSSNGLGALAGTAGVVLDEARGHLLARAFDCEGAPAADVRISDGQLGVAFSFEGGLPRVGSDVTSSDGIAGYVNVPPGLVFVVGRELDAGRECGATSLVVRKGWLTYGDIEPSAR